MVLRMLRGTQRGAAMLFIDNIDARQRGGEKKR